MVAALDLLLFGRPGTCFSAPDLEPVHVCAYIKLAGLMLSTWTRTA